MPTIWRSLEPKSFRCRLPGEPLIAWIREIQSRQGFVSEQDFAELAYVPTIEELALFPEGPTYFKCVGPACTLFGEEVVSQCAVATRGASAYTVSREICLGRCWQAPVCVLSDRVYANNVEVPFVPQLTSYLQDGGYGVYKNCASGRRSADSIIETLSTTAFTLHGSAKLTLGQSLKDLRTREAPVVLLVSLDEASPQTMASSFFVDQCPHACLEALFILGKILKLEVLVHASPIHQPTSARLQFAIDKLKASSWSLPSPIRFLGPQPLSLSDVRQYSTRANLLTLDIETLHRIPTAIAVGQNGKLSDSVSFSLVGCLSSPGIHSAPKNVTVRELIKLADGMRPGHTFDCFVVGSWDQPAFGSNYLDLPVFPESRTTYGPAFPIWVLSKEAAISRQHAFGRNTSC